MHRRRPISSLGRPRQVPQVQVHEVQGHIRYLGLESSEAPQNMYPQTIRDSSLENSMAKTGCPPNHLKSHMSQTKSVILSLSQTSVSYWISHSSVNISISHQKQEAHAFLPLSLSVIKSVPFRLLNSFPLCSDYRCGPSVISKLPVSPH